MVNTVPSFLITGPRKAGKSTLCLDVLHYYQKLGHSTGGVITLQNSQRWFYLIQSKKKVPFEARNQDSYISIGNFKISETNLQLAVDHIQEGLDSTFLFIDEIGILEMEEKGYFPILEAAFTRASGNVFVIRESILDDFIHRFQLKFDYDVLRCEFNKNESLLTQVKRKIDKDSLKR